jgi:hypothetical protein
MNAVNPEHLEIWRLCQSCALEIYGAKPPNDRYAGIVARLLFGTAAKESGLVWRRQRTCTYEGDVGGFSLWQVEWDSSVVPSAAYLRRRTDVWDRATDWLWRDVKAPRDWLTRMDKSALLWSLRGWDRMGCLFARLHYLRVQAAIPERLEDQAAYWLTYNNGGGVLKYHSRAAALRQYTDAWESLCAPVVVAAGD